MPKQMSMTGPKGEVIPFTWWESREPEEQDLEAIYNEYNSTQAAAQREHPPNIMGIPMREARPEEMPLAMDPMSMLATGLGGVTLPPVGAWAKVKLGLGAKSIEKVRPIQKAAQPKGTVAKTAEALRVSGETTAKQSILPQAGNTVTDIYKEAESPIVTAVTQEEAKVAKATRSVAELTEAEKFNVRALPPNRNMREMTKSDFDILKDESGAVQLDLFATPIEKTRAGIKDLLERGHSPYYVMDKDPTGRAGMINRRCEEADRAKAMFLKRMREERIAKVKLSPNTVESDRVGELLDEYEKAEDIPAFKWGILNENEKAAFKYYRQKFNESGDLLEKLGLIGVEGKPKRLKSYLFRVFDKDTVYNAARSERDFALGELATEGLNAKQTAVLKTRLEKLNKMVSEYERSGTILYDYIPKEIQVPFLKPRTGAKGYSIDAVRAYDLYEQFIAKKLFDEPAIKDSVALFNAVPPEYKEYTRKFLRQFAGIERENKFNNLARMFTAFEYYKDMGFNVRSALVNATQNLNTIVDIGPRWTAEGAYRAMFDPEARALWKASGHAADVPSMRYGLVSKTAERFGKYPWYLFDKVEIGNRATAYIGGYYKAISEGKSPLMAKVYADDVVRKTNFIYGRTGSPMALHSTGGPMLMQFSTFSIKQLEFLTTLAREDKKKLAAYLLIANGINETTKELGVDFSNAVGIGVDFRELWKGFKSLHKGEGTAAWMHTKLGLPKIPGTNIGSAGSGIFPQGVVPVLETLKSTLDGEWDKLLPAQYTRTHQAISALREGQITAALPGEDLASPEKGYPIRNIRTDYLKTIESPAQLFTRVAGPRSYEESKEFHDLAAMQMSDDTRKAITQEALIAYGKGNEKEFNRLMTKFNLAFTDDDFNRLYLNRMTTPSMRKRMEQLKSEKGIYFRQSLGEPILPNMP